MSKPGPKTVLEDKEVVAKIKELILAGKTYKETAELIEVPVSTFYTWVTDNYLNLAIKLDGWKKDRKLNLAEQKIEDILELPISDKESLKVQADIAKFTAETLGKADYSKRTDLTTGGEKLPTPILNGYVQTLQTDNSNKEDTVIIETNQDLSGGNLSE